MAVINILQQYNCLLINISHELRKNQLPIFYTNLLFTQVNHVLNTTNETDDQILAHDRINSLYIFFNILLISRWFF